MEDSVLEELKGKLYSKKLSIDSRKKDIKFESTEKPPEVKEGWDQKDEKIEDVINQAAMRNKPISTSVKKLIILFFAFSLLIATLFLFYSWLKSGTGTTSSGNVEVKMGGPVSVTAGEPFLVYLELKNKGNMNIETADLVLEYPAGMRPKSNQNIELGRDRKVLGQIKSGESVNQILELVAFGEGGSDKTIKAIVEYRLENSSATLVDSSSFSFKILQSPVDIVLNFPTEVRTRQEIDFEVEVKSNSSSLVRDLYLQIDYPPGFQFTSAKPEPMKDNIWKLGDLVQGKSKKVVLTGTIEGQDSEEKNFHATVGNFSNDQISNIHASTNKSIVLSKPDFNASIFINGKDLEKNALSSGDIVMGEIVWSNNLPVAIDNPVIRLKIGGNAVDLRTIFANTGYYKTLEESIVWSRSSEPKLASIGPGQGGSVDFKFSIKKPLSVSSVNDKNFTVTLEASIVGTKTEEGEENVEIRSDVLKKIAISSDLQLAVKGLYYSGPFKNTGPLPPKVGQETTYTVVWSIANSFNDVTDAKVSAVLPSYMRWLGVVSPSGAPVSFNEGTGTIIWNKGLVRAGAGILSPSEEVAFQVGLTPALNQADTSPNLLGDCELSGTDSFTGLEIKRIKGAISSMLTGDQKFRNQEGVVEK